MKGEITVLVGVGYCINSLVYAKTGTGLIDIHALDMTSVGASSHDVITTMETKTEPSNSNKQPNSRAVKQKYFSLFPLPSCHVIKHRHTKICVQDYHDLLERRRTGCPTMRQGTAWLCEGLSDGDWNTATYKKPAAVDKYI